MEEIIFPNQIRMYRRLRGRSMQELADHLSVSLSAISKIEKGYRRVDQEQLVRVAEFLDCPLQDLFVNEQNSQQEVVQSWRREQERRNKINEKSGLKTLGAGLRQIRNEKNLTLIEVAESADMTLSVYHRIEMGQREVSDKEFKNIAKAINMAPEELKEQIKALEDKGCWKRLFSATMPNTNCCPPRAEQFPLSEIPIRTALKFQFTAWPEKTATLSLNSVRRPKKFSVRRSYTTKKTLMPLIFAPAASEACCRHVQFCLSIRRMLSASETLPFITAMKKKPKSSVSAKMKTDSFTA